MYASLGLNELTHWAETKLPQICRPYFEISFVEIKLFGYIFTEVCSKTSNEKYASIGWDNGWVPNNGVTHHLNHCEDSFGIDWRILRKTTFLFKQERYKQRFLTPGHQGWNDLHSLCRIGMEYDLLNNDDNNIIYWIMMIIMIMMMMIIIMIIMMTMMIIGTATIMIMIIIITTTLTMTIMKLIMIKTAQTPCQSLYKDRRI